MPRLRAGKKCCKETRLGTLLRVSFMPRQQDHDAFDLEFICEEMPYLGSLTRARSARFGSCCHANNLGEPHSGTSRDGPPLAPAGDIPAALGLKTFLKGNADDRSSGRARLHFHGILFCRVWRQHLAYLARKAVSSVATIHEPISN
jgi:hypothetical protein